MAGFRYAGNKNGSQNRIAKELPIKDTVVVTPGAVLKYENDRYSLCASGEKPAAIAELPMGTTSLTGDTGGTVECVGRLILPGDFYEVAQGALADAAIQVGDTADITATTCDGITTDSNHDVMVYRNDLARNLAYVEFLNARS